MNALQIELPIELKSELEALGLTEEARVSAWVADAIRLKLSAAKQLQYLESRATRGSREAFQHVLAKVPPVEPAAEDRW